MGAPVFRHSSSAAPPTLALRVLNVCHRHTASLRTAMGTLSPPHEAKTGLRGDGELSSQEQHFSRSFKTKRFSGTIIKQRHDLRNTF
ncbi:MAG: hypothetical protein FWE20_11005, partial [Defluviitaleaceae bacterium]|nr:hypothetical protein [Defluviitaleaceae bacterium]